MAQLSGEQWREVLGRSTNLLTSGYPLIGSYELGKNNPVGLDPQNQAYWTDMTGPQRNALVQDFFAIIDLVIANLQKARAGTPPVDWTP